MAIISIAQQASPNVSGQIEPLCAQRTAFSTVVNMSFCSRSGISLSNLLSSGRSPVFRISSRSVLSP
jgi:hypothetical protein